MRFKVMVLLWFAFSMTAHAYSSVEEIYIETEFYGVLNKTRAEFIIYNQGDRDDEATITLQLNKSAIVTDMWLEIDGRLEKAETMDRDTGEQIYGRIVERRIDPALMIKRENGAYELNVFPVEARKSRKVVIEYVCVVESADKGYPVWTFGTHAQHVCLNIKEKYPQGMNVHISPLRYQPYGKLIDQKENYFEFENPHRIDLVLFLENNALRFFKSNSDMLFEKQDLSLNRYDFDRDELDQLVELLFYLKGGQRYLVTYRKNDRFLKAFFSYLSRTGKIKYDYHTEAKNWIVNQQNYEYLDNAFQLRSDFKETSNVEKCYCPFLDVYEDYLFSLQEPVNVQRLKGYLTKRFSKIVIEKDKRAQRIRQEELQYQDQRHANTSGDFQTKANSSLDQDMRVSYAASALRMDNYVPARPIGGDAKIQEKLYYPSFLQKLGLGGTVRVSCGVDRFGNVTHTHIETSLHPLLDQEAIRAVKSVEWEPTNSDGKDIDGGGTVVVEFNNNTKIVEMDEIEHSVFEQLGRTLELWTANPRNVFEQGFDADLAIELELESDAFFKFLMEHPECIKLVYRFFYRFKTNQLGFVENGQSVLIFRN